MTGPRVAPMPDDVMDKVRALHADQTALPRPERVGRSIAIKRKPG